MTAPQFNRLFLFSCSLVPAVLLLIDFLDGHISGQQDMMRITGICTFIFLALSLLITPLRRLTGKNHWSLYRRQLGLFAFFYSCLHVLIYTLLRHSGNLSKALSEIFQNRFVFFGFFAFLLMVPLAATSTVWAIKKMGNKKWKLLHKLVYLTAISASIHYFLSGKITFDSLKTFLASVTAAPLKIIIASLFAALLLFRLAAWLRDKYLPVKPQPRAAMSRPAPPIRA